MLCEVGRGAVGPVGLCVEVAEGVYKFCHGGGMVVF